MTLPISPSTNDAKNPQPAANGTHAEATSLAALPFDPTKHPDDVLKAVVASIQDVLATRHEQRLAEALAAFSERAEEAKALGITPARLKAYLEGKDRGWLAPTGTKEKTVDGRSVVAAKFANPKNPAERWSGRGNSPRWYTDALASGLTEDDLLIPEGK